MEGVVVELRVFLDLINVFLHALHQVLLFLDHLQLLLVLVHDLGDLVLGHLDLPLHLHRLGTEHLEMGLFLRGDCLVLLHLVG